MSILRLGRHVRADLKWQREWQERHRLRLGRRTVKSAYYPQRGVLA